MAFGLGPARHLRINEETLAYREQQDEGPRTSWLAAEPMWLQPQLRESGRTPQPGRIAELVDLSKERETLRRLAEKENAQIARAHDMLATIAPTYLSDFATLDAAAFNLLLELLGRGVSAAAQSEKDAYPVTAHSSDGSLAIELWPPSESSRTARIDSEWGTLSGPNFRVHIRATDGTQLEIRMAAR